MQKEFYLLSSNAPGHNLNALICLFFQQLLPGGFRRIGPKAAGRDVPKQLHGLSGSNQRHPESAGPPLAAVTVRGVCDETIYYPPWGCH